MPDVRIMRDFFRVMTGVLGCFLLVAEVQGQEELTVPLSTDSPEVIKAEEALNVMRRHFHFDEHSTVAAYSNIDGAYALYGDLFQTGTNYALVHFGPGNAQEGEDATVGLLFAEWDDKQCEVRGLWRIDPIWRPEGWKNSELEYFPVQPSTRPFWLMPENKNGTREVIVVGGISKYYQEHYVFHFDPATRTLQLVGDSMDLPYYSGDYLVLPYDSGRRAVYNGWRFLQWDHGKWNFKARWQDGVYEGSDERFLDGSVYEATGIFDGKEKDFVIHSLADDGARFLVAVDDNTEATVAITEKQPRDLNATEALELDVSIRAYFFRKLANLKEEVFPGDTTPRFRLEDRAQIQVDGSPELRKPLRPH